MTLKTHGIALTDAFLEELSSTLDVRKTIKKLGISDDQAREILIGLKSTKVYTQSEKPRENPPKHDSGGAYSINVDGASRGNPGNAGAGAVIKDGDGRIVRKLKKRLGVTTNNVAEYEALIMGLEAARSMGVATVRVFADSELMVKQINGVYKVKSPALTPLYERAKLLTKTFASFKIMHVFREDNAAADALANEALDG